MTPGNPPVSVNDPTLFSAVLRPYRSLSWTGFLWVMGAVALLNIIAAVVFVGIGAWPVLPFLGLDVLVVWLAFRASYLSARAYEEVVVTPYEVWFRKVSQHGGVREWRLTSLWTRLERETDEDGIITSLQLSERGRRHEIASLIPPPQRTAFADALDAALRSARQGMARA